MYRPFQLGDFIQTGGALGAVHEVQMFNTVLNAPDGKVHMMPNGMFAIPYPRQHVHLYTHR